MDSRPLVEIPSRLLEPSARTGPALLLGVDGGATKTVAALLDTGSGAVHLGHGGPSNEDAVGRDTAMASVADALDAALGAADRSRGEVSAAVLALAGTATARIAAAVAETFDPAWTVVNDVVAAWAAATGAAPGVAAISGTGSNVFGVGPDGRGWRSGGWGYLLGDEGSGFWVARRAIAAALGARDASAPATALAGAACRHFGVEPIELLAREIYARPIDHAAIAAFGAVVADVAAEGDAVARRILREAGIELAVRVNAVIARTGLAGSFKIGLVGSNWRAGEPMVEPFAELVHRSSPDAEIAPVDLEPVGGSLLLAARAAGVHLEPAEVERGLDDALRERLVQ